MLGLPDYAGDIGTVNAILKREEGAFGVQFERGVFGEKFLDDLIVFLGFEAAGAVNDDATGFDLLGGA
jgi:hypothetical protein